MVSVAVSIIGATCAFLAIISLITIAQKELRDEFRLLIVAVLIYWAVCITPTDSESGRGIILRLFDVARSLRARLKRP